MKCKACNKEVEVATQDPDFTKYEIKDGKAVMELVSTVRCADCYVELAKHIWRLEDDISENILEHQGDGHFPALHPSGYTRFDENVLTVNYRLVCSCESLDSEQSGMAELVTN